MPRTVVYPRESSKAKGPEEPIIFAGRGAKPRKADVFPSDDYASKLVKFVPAEVLAFFAPLAAALEQRRTLLVIATAIAFLATPGYLWLGARTLPAEQKPLFHLYPLSAIAFLAWGLGTTSIRGFVGLDALATSFMLATSVFLIPLLDGMFVAFQARRVSRKET